MNRRSFLKFLLSTPLALTVDVEKLLWVPKPIITVPAMPSIYGVDWGLNDGTVGTWLGIKRSIYPQFKSAWLHPAQGECYKDLVKLISICEEDKRKYA